MVRKVQLRAPGHDCTFRAMRRGPGGERPGRARDPSLPFGPTQRSVWEVDLERRRAESIERALEIAKKQNLGRNCEVTFPTNSEAFFVAEPAATSGSA
jgi:hypothetical protein